VSNPLSWLKEENRRAAFWVLLVATLVVFAAISALDGPLHTPAAPNGIVSYELAGSPAAAEAVLASWDARARVFAGLSLGVDYLFMVLYALTIGLGCLLVGEGLGGWAVRAARWLAWAQILAAGLDAVENWALIRWLLGSRVTVWPRLAAGCATVKFALVGLGLLFVFGGTLALLARRWRG